MSPEELKRRDQLVLENQNLIWFAWHKYKHTYAFRRMGAEEVFSAGQLGLLEAATRYKEEMGRFSTYAVWWIRAKVQEEASTATNITIPRNVLIGIGTPEMMEQAKKAMRAMSIFSREGKIFVNPSTRSKVPLWEMEGWEELQDALRFVHPEYRDKILDYYRDSLTLDEIGQKHGITKERVRQLIIMGMRKLCRRLGLKVIPTPRTHVKGKCNQKHVRPLAQVETE